MSTEARKPRNEIEFAADLLTMWLLKQELT
jgi:hypothetical protein